MKLPAPEPGSVIRYAYLWADEQRRGREEGRKDRPVLVLAVSVVQRENVDCVLYGNIPKHLLRKVARSFLANRERQRGGMIHR